jgi:phosphomannomutase
MSLNLDLKGLKNFKLPGFMKDPMLYLISGLAIVVMMTIMLFSGSSGERSGSKAYEQGVRAKDQMREAVNEFNRLLQDPEVINLAEMALQDPESTDALNQYLSGRASEFKAARLFEPNDYLNNAEQLGENAWIAMDMMLSSLETGLAPVQIITSGSEQVAAGMAVLGDEENRSGFLMLMLDQKVILSAFNMTMPLGGYIALEQAHGRFTPTVINAFGEDEGLTAGLQSINIPGSLLRVLVPAVEADAAGSGFGRLLMFLLGAGLLVIGVIMRQRRLHPVAELTEDPASLGEDHAGAPPDKGLHLVDSVDTARPDEPAEPEEPVEPELPPVSLSELPFNVGSRKRELPAAESPVELSPEIFRAYDIRGIVGKTLDRDVVFQIGQAIGSQALEEEAAPVLIGRDGRHSGPELSGGLKEGIASTGCDVIDIGAVPTGVLYFAAYENGSGSGVMLTGSHNPPDYNGLKVMMGGKTLAQEKITAIYDRIQAGNIRIGKGSISQQDMLEAYRERIAGDIQLDRPLKVVADCGNGIGGVCAADVLRSIGAEVLPMFDEVDGSFPNHHPDPSDPKNLEELIDTVKLMEADLGVAFDGDADRLGVVTPSGEIIFSDRLMILFIREILGRNPGERIIYDVKCTGKLHGIISEAGGEPEMYKTGHSLIKNRMKEVGAPFAAEMSGHFFFTDRWYGFDCGIYSAAGLLEILARDERTPEQIMSSLPNDFSTPELKVEMEEGENHVFIETFQEKARFADARVNTIDGLRADYDYGWGLVRASNTTPILVVRFEADTEESLQIIQEAFRMQMLALNPNLNLPF